MKIFCQISFVRNVLNLGNKHSLPLSVLLNTKTNSSSNGLFNLLHAKMNSASVLWQRLLYTYFKYLVASILLNKCLETSLLPLHSYNKQI